MKQLLVFLLAVISYPVIAQNNLSGNNLKQYYLVILTKGPNRMQDSLTAEKIQKAHLANIGRLHQEGKIDIAGPFADDTDWRGVFVFNVETQQEVEKLLQTDEAISSGRLSYIIYPWYAQKGSILR